MWEALRTVEEEGQESGRREESLEGVEAAEVAVLPVSLVEVVSRGRRVVVVRSNDRVVVVVAVAVAVAGIDMDVDTGVDIERSVEEVEEVDNTLLGSQDVDRCAAAVVVGGSAPALVSQLSRSLESRPYCVASSLRWYTVRKRRPFPSHVSSPFNSLW